MSCIVFKANMFVFLEVLVCIAYDSHLCAFI